MLKLELINYKWLNIRGKNDTIEILTWNDTGFDPE